MTEEKEILGVKNVPSWVRWAILWLGVIGFIVFLYWYYRHLKPVAKLAEAAKH